LNYTRKIFNLKCDWDNHIFTSLHIINVIKIFDIIITIFVNKYIFSLDFIIRSKIINSGGDFGDAQLPEMFSKKTIDRERIILLLLTS